MPPSDDVMSKQALFFKPGEDPGSDLVIPGEDPGSSLNPCPLMNFLFALDSGSSPG